MDRTKSLTMKIWDRYWENLQKRKDYPDNEIMARQFLFIGIVMALLLLIGSALAPKGAKLSIMNKPSRNGIEIGDMVRVLQGKYAGLETTCIDLGATDRIKITIPYDTTIKNLRNIGWIKASYCKTIS